VYDSQIQELFYGRTHFIPYKAVTSQQINDPRKIFLDALTEDSFKELLEIRGKDEYITLHRMFGHSIGLDFFNKRLATAFLKKDGETITPSELDKVRSGSEFHFIVEKLDDAGAAKIKLRMSRITQKPTIGVLARGIADYSQEPPLNITKYIFVVPHTTRLGVIAEEQLAGVEAK
jgi:hypothetical protein